MRKFIAIAAIACSLSLFLAVQPAMAQHHGGGGGGHGGGGGGHGGGSFHTGGGSFHTGGGSFHTGGGYGRGYYGGYGRGYYGGGLYGGYYGGLPYYGYGAYSYPYSGYAYQPYYNNYYYSYPAYTYVLGDDSNYAGPPPASSTVIRQAAYSPPEDTDRATVHIMMPDPNGQVYFDGSQTKQTGVDRVFTTPALEPGKDYIYTIKATWMDNGNPATWSKDVKVQAGRETTVDLRKPAPPQQEK